ncbi:MAG: 16S rRNA (cytosine(1402)-N(4))-methyltransferase RsmH [Coriobacteriaceae bacterium]|nr:16S rRNA (cytosine(1402)-N(4))-methyltransferase RsmH [Coriobacteriaceae bacterium]
MERCDLITEYRHIPVLLHECREHLALRAGEVYCDCTLGGAGHAIELANDIVPEGMLIGIDQDEMAHQAAAKRLQAEMPDLRFMPLKGNFAQLDELLLAAKIPGVDAFLFDLGVSSPQLDISARGFSYAQDAPLDMRMDPGKQSLTAAEIINTSTEADLTWILRTYGEEKWAPRIAQFIVRQRLIAPVKTTSELVELIKAAIPQGARKTRGNPAKRTFQALRIKVNAELDALESGLDAAIRWLNPGGRIAVISYHSLEDRIVKEKFAQLARGCVCPPEAPVCVCGHQPILTIKTKRPLVASDDEVSRNPRSKSAKLIVAVKN